MKRILFLSCLSASALFGYNLPRVNLGLTNILDGGPLREAPGWYSQQYAQYYRTRTFLDDKGCPLDGVCPLEFQAFSAIVQLFYQSRIPVLFGGKVGFSASLPVTFKADVERNPLGITSYGSGFGNLNLGVSVQWHPIMLHERPFFIHRIEFDIFLPSGDYGESLLSINPGPHFFAMGPYWAAAIHMRPRWAVSWRVNYVWCAKDPVTQIQSGDAVYLNYDMEYEITKGLWVALCGYYLRQLRDSRFQDVIVPESREQVVGVGPGILYSLPKNFTFFTYLYVEKKVTNRPQGINFILRLLKHF
jgi:hypothetical protein